MWQTLLFRSYVDNDTHKFDMLWRRLLTCSWQTNIWCRHERIKVVRYSPGNFGNRTLLCWFILITYVEHWVVLVTSCRELLLHIWLWHWLKLYREVQKPKIWHPAHSPYSSCTIGTGNSIFLWCYSFFPPCEKCVFFIKWWQKNSSFQNL